MYPGLVKTIVPVALMDIGEEPEKPRLVRAVEVLFRSERLLRTFSQVELARVAVSVRPRFVLAVELLFMSDRLLAD